LAAVRHRDKCWLLSDTVTSVGCCQTQDKCWLLSDTGQVLAAVRHRDKCWLLSDTGTSVGCCQTQGQVLATVRHRDKCWLLSDTGTMAVDRSRAAVRIRDRDRCSDTNGKWGPRDGYDRGSSVSIVTRLRAG